LCGIEPPHSVRTVSGERGALAGRCIGNLLEKFGYKSVFFQSARSDFEDRPQVIENMGFGEFFPLESMDKNGFERANRFGYEDDIMLAPSRNWLKQHKQSPFVA